MRRLKVFIIMLIILLVAIVLGAVSPLNEPEAKRIIEDLEGIIPQELGIQTIFINNLKIALFMLIPVLGLGLGVYIIYNTGLVFSAYGVATGVPGSLLLLITVLLPFFWLEFIAYAASMTENTYLIFGITRHSIRGEIRRLAHVVALLVVLLLVGAIAEVFILSLFR